VKSCARGCQRSGARATSRNTLSTGLLTSRRGLLDALLRSLASRPPWWTTELVEVGTTLALDGLAGASLTTMAAPDASSDLTGSMGIANAMHWAQGWSDSRGPVHKDSQMRGQLEGPHRARWKRIVGGPFRLSNVVLSIADEGHAPHGFLPSTSACSPSRYHSSPAPNSRSSSCTSGTSLIAVTIVPFSRSRRTIRTSSGRV
jgi:hypothetical protein